jgi:hypothetical protein
MVIARASRRTTVKTPLFALAAGLIAMSASAASAFPSAKLDTNGSGITTTVAEHDGNNNYGMKKRHTRHRMIHRDNDDRYQQYSGWHRYSHRPSRWSNRGCVAVGPIWFCP